MNLVIEMDDTVLNSICRKISIREHFHSSECQQQGRQGCKKFGLRNLAAQRSATVVIPYTVMRLELATKSTDTQMTTRRVHRGAQQWIRLETCDMCLEATCSGNRKEVYFNILKSV